MSKNTKTVNRVDFYDLDSENTWKVEKMQKTDEGFLQGRAVVTNIGVFSYRDSEGNIIRELRSEKEVMNEDSLNTLIMKPITNNHPKDAVDKENYKDYVAGSLGNDVRIDGLRVSIPVSINDAGAVMDVENGKTSLSCGYKADLEMKSGVFMGVHYDAIQKNIRYNHVSLVSQGRAGDDAVLKMDGVSVLVKNNQDSNLDKNNTEVIMPKLKIDGVDFEVDTNVALAYNKLKEKFDNSESTLQKVLTSAKEDKTAIEAEKDALQTKVDSLEKELENKMDATKIDEMVKSKVALLNDAKTYEIEVKDGMSDLEIKKEVICKLNPDSKEKIDNAEEDYVNVFYEATKDLFSKTKKDSKFDGMKPKTDGTQPEEKKDAADAYWEMIYNKSRGLEV